MSIYLDYNATTPIDQRVLDTMIDVYKNKIGNADSRTHDFGDQARGVVENARAQVSKLLNVNTDEVFFTSGATESNNIAIQGLKAYAEQTGKTHIITTSIEHKAVLETCKAMQEDGFEVDFVKPDFSGRVSSADVLGRIKSNTLLVSVMHVNNETGIIQPVKEIGEELAGTEVLFHIDATQSVGKLTEEIRQLKYDMLSFSAHKLRGPQGVGCLILKKRNYQLPPVKNILYGGQQERGIRPGTIPVALVAGCGKACELAEAECLTNEKQLRDIQATLKKLLEQSGLSYQFNGLQEFCIPSTMNIWFQGIDSEALMISTKQFCGISNGSACTSRSYTPSYVLTEMGLSQERIEQSVRISWGADTNKERLVDAFSDFLKIAQGLAW